MVLGTSYANVLLQDLTMTLNSQSKYKHVRITCKTSYCKNQAVCYQVYFLSTSDTQRGAAKTLFHFSNSLFYIQGQIEDHSSNFAP